MKTYIGRLYIGLDGAPLTVEGRTTREHIGHVVKEAFPTGATVFEGYGLWESEKTGETIEEDSVVVERISQGQEDLGKLLEVAARLKGDLDQEAIGYTAQELEAQEWV